MAVLVIGATGFIGPAVGRALSAMSADWVGASRRGGGCGGVALDRRDMDGVRAVVRERRITRVVDLLAYTQADTLPLLEALDGRVERWVMASSCDVYRNYEGLHQKAKRPPVAGLLAESSPLRTRLYPYRRRPRRPAGAADAWMDDYDKIPLERALRTRPGLAGVVVRLPMVFGPGDRQRRFRWVIAPMLKRIERLRVDPAWARWRTTYGFVEDVGHALAAAALHPAAAGRTFNIGELAPPDHLAWVERVAKVLDWRGAVELDSPAEGGPLAALDLAYPLATDTRAFREACSWREPTALEEALARTIEDEARRG